MGMHYMNVDCIRPHLTPGTDDSWQETEDVDLQRDRLTAGVLAALQDATKGRYFIAEVRLDQWMQAVCACLGVRMFHWGWCKDNLLLRLC